MGGCGCFSFRCCHAQRFTPSNEQATSCMRQHNGVHVGEGIPTTQCCNVGVYEWADNIAVARFRTGCQGAQFAPMALWGRFGLALIG